MHDSLRRLVAILAVVLGSEALAADAAAASTESPQLMAGAMAVDISPQTFPVRQNGGFLERTVDRVAEPLHARALVLRRDGVRLAIAVVDSCMLPRALCDDVKARVEREVGIARDRILISATHTHSAPGVMDYCLGSRADPAYTELLPPLIARAIQGAAGREEPAELGFTLVHAPDHTACRRWIRRLDRPDRDPFGQPTVGAMMHPGHQNPDYVGPSGPEDPALSMLAVRSVSGRPIAFLGNYSMHYFGVGGGLSPDFFGRFARRVAERLAPSDPAFVGILSQGTSGDIWRADYGQPRPKIDIETYTSELVDLALRAHRTLRYASDATLAMAEQRLTFRRRVPDQDRLTWAKSLLPDPSARPKNRPEVYAEQAFFIAENPTEEVVLQAVRIGELGITAIPCEVYALTGLELKARSPLQPTFNLSLANGAAGYIPPPEQHALGGYTTWPARTAGLEVEAEPKIVGHILKLLEQVAGEPQREPTTVHGQYPTMILSENPAAYWRLEEFRGALAKDSSGAGRHARIRPRAAFRLPGPVSSAFSREHKNHALHLVDGYLESAHRALGTDWSVELWFWNGVHDDDRKQRGTLLRRGADHLELAEAGDRDDTVLRAGTLRGQTPCPTAQWQHVVFVRAGDSLHVYLNGQPELEGKSSVLEGPTVESAAAPGTAAPGTATPGTAAPGTTTDDLLTIGSGAPRAPGLQGRIDEVSLFSRALTPNEVARHFNAAGLERPDPPESTPTKIDGSARPPIPPRSPSETLLATGIRDGFRLELVAAEPLVQDPVAIDWDQEGRLWVAEMADYPMGGPDANPGGRVRVLTDRDHDGRYDDATVFASGLSFPNGVFAWRRGAIVTAAPDILYLEDTTGSGQADRREVLYTGFLPGNQQLRVNGLRWGLDNWIYCASGGHHAGYGADRRIRSQRTGIELHLGSRDLRIRPADGSVQPQSGPAQFGRVRDDWGHWFGVQNSRPLWHYVLADHYAQRNPHLPAPSAKQQLRSVGPPLWPAKTPQKRYHSFEHAKHFTSACGPGIYRDELLFPRDGRTHAFTCDPFHSLVQHNVLSRNGVTFQAKVDTRPGQRDFFASTDRWCRPVMARTGPDGALWIVDMYRYVIEHPDWLPPVGKEELRPFYRAGDDRGRIYRVVPMDGGSRDTPVLARDNGAALVERLRDPNGIVRDLAQRTLVETANPGVLPKLETMGIEDARPLARVHALATLDGLGALTRSVVLSALRDPDPRVVRHAVRLAEPFAAAAEILEAAAQHAVSADPDTRLQLAHSLGEWKHARAGEALGKLAVRDHESPWIGAAIISSAIHHQDALAKALTTGPSPGLRTFAPQLLTLAIKTGAWNALARLVAPIVEPSTGTVQAWHLDALSTLLQTIESEGTTLEEMAARDSHLRSLPEQVERLLQRAPELARDASRADDVRRAAVLLLGRAATRASADHDLLKDILRTSVPSVVQVAAVARLRELGGDPDGVLLGWKSYVPAVRAAVFGAVLSHSDWTHAFLEAVRTEAVPADTVSAAERQRLVSLRDAPLAEFARSVLPGAAVGQRSATIATFLPALNLNGLQSRGQVIFAARCGACHVVDGVGKAIGPDLRALTDVSGHALLTAILDPNATVEPRYVAYSAVLTSGEVVHGLVTSETGNSLNLQLPDGSERALLRGAIEQLESSEKSYMPEGLEADLSLRDMADLIAFLRDAGSAVSDTRRPSAE